MFVSGTHYIYLLSYCKKSEGNGCFRITNETNEAMLEHLQNHEAQLLMKLTTRTCAVLMPLNPFSSLRMKLWIASCGG